VQYALFGYKGESKCVRCRQQATQVTSEPVFKLECLRPKTAKRGHLNLDVQTDTGIKIHGRPETFGRPGQVNNLAHLKTDILSSFQPRTRLARFHIADNFWRNSYACENPRLLAPYLRLPQ